jgi:exodeoxyribonuclease V alpha subunit
LDVDCLIVDEASMIDTMLMYSLLSALRPGTRLVLVGDADQLPSVEPGNVLSDLIESDSVPVIRLDTIHRQSEKSMISLNARSINRGEVPFIDNHSDFVFIRKSSHSEISQEIRSLIRGRLKASFGIDPIKDVQVIAPFKKGEVGVIALNASIQEVLNPPDDRKAEKQFGSVVFREGDKVMQIRNNYKMEWESTITEERGKGIYNGDIGTIVSIDNANETLRIDFDGRLADYGFDSLLELEHAWAITVHKAQGSEYRAVILALSPNAKLLLTRDILYTAVTRAKELLIMVGDDQTAYQMIDNYRQTKRYTALRVRMRKLCGVDG